MPSPVLVPLRRRREAPAAAALASRPPLPWRGGDFLLHGGSLPLDEGQRLQRYRGLSASVVGQVIVVAMVLAGLAIGPRPIRLKPDPPERESITYLVAPPPPVHYHPRARPEARRQPVLKTQPVVPLPPRARPAVKVKLPTAPAVKLNDSPPVLAAAAPPPPPPPAPKPTVQLGRFGAPSGITATTGAPVAVARLGNFGAGEKSDPPDPPASAAVGSAGFDGPARAAQRSGDVSGQVRSSGFGGPEAGDPPAAVPGAGAGGGVQLQGFAASAPARAVVVPKVVPAAPEFTPPQIVSWPTPAYTADARQNHIEGEVTVEVKLGADGTVTILRLVHGLGHGLDENAEAAARQLSFRPARRHGQAVDWTVRVHIQFRLAN